MVRLDNEPCHPEHQLGTLSALAEVLGELDNSRLVPKDGLRVPPRQQRRVAVQRHREWYTDEWDANLDDVALQKVLSNERKAPCGVQNTSGIETLDHRAHDRWNGLSNAFPH